METITQSVSVNVWSDDINSQKTMKAEDMGIPLQDLYKDEVPESRRIALLRTYLSVLLTELVGWEEGNAIWHRNNEERWRPDVAIELQPTLTLRECPPVVELPRIAHRTVAVLKDLYGGLEPAVKLLKLADYFEGAVRLGVGYENMAHFTLLCPMVSHAQLQRSVVGL